MAEPQAGPVFKIAGVYVRTRINADGTHGAHPGDIRQVEAMRVHVTDGEVQKLLAWLRGGAPLPTRTIEVRKIPFAIMPIGVVGRPAAVIEADDPAAVYTPLFELMGYLGLAAEEGEEYVNAGVLKLSALKQGAQLDGMLVRGDDAQIFMQVTGLRAFSGRVS